MDYKPPSKYTLNDSAGEEQEAETGSPSSSEKAPKEKPSTGRRPSKQNSSKKPDDNICYTFQDMPPSSKETLEIVYHEPVYELPIPTNPKYMHLSVAERAKLLNDYWIKIRQLEAKLARKSLRRAPFSSPILPSDDCKDSLLKNPGGESNTVKEPSQHIPTQDFYISRHGRQVKRKTYTEDVENDGDSDSDFASPLKKNKSVINSDTKIILDTPFVPEEHHNDENSTPRGLFKPKKRNLPRCEQMFENLMKEEQTQKEREMAAFERTLPTLSEEEEENVLLVDDNSPVKEGLSEVNEDNFTRRRVVPPVPTKKTAKPKQQSQEDFDKIDVVPTTPPDSPILKQYGSVKKSVAKRRPPIKSKAKKSTEDAPKINCPICGKEFLQSEIEDHAANCDNFESEFQEKKAGSENRITCSLCDQAFLVNTEYEVHVKQCIAEKVVEM